MKTIGFADKANEVAEMALNLRFQLMSKGMPAHGVSELQCQRLMDELNDTDVEDEAMARYIWDNRKILLTIMPGPSAASKHALNGVIAQAQQILGIK